jgi:predicted CXXCH cytochrome family protein
MRARWLGVLAVLGTLAPLSALAIDAPHDGSFANGTCEACHMIHNAVGGTLINQSDNNTACTVCHNTNPALPSRARLGLPWLTEDQSVPGKGGAHHRWDALADQPAFGASMPTNAQVAKRVKDGRIQCAACHDAHADVKANDPGALHTSIATGVPIAVTGGSATMTMTLSPPTAAANTRGYRVQVLRLSGLTFELGISHDAQTIDGPPTWLVHNGTTWVAGTSAGTGQRFWSTGAAVALDDGTAVQVTFAGTAAVGQYWDFYVSYAHLRASNVVDALCLDCHSQRNQNHVFVEGPGNGSTVFSHPVGQALGANGKGYDRAPTNLLDASGVVQVTGDGNATNDLTLVGGTTVSCTTCHSVHNSDSNSLTVDPR